MPRLLVEKGPDRGKSFTVTAGRQFVAGRDKSADLQLTDSMASRRHFIIANKGAIFGLKDLNSANGTLVNGHRAEGAQRLQYGDSIQVGETLMSWMSDEQAGSRAGLVGNVVGGYRIEERLGRGAMGTVYKAIQLSLGRTIALKVLAADLTKDQKFCQMFLKEARAAGSLNHPNIIQVYDVGDEKGAYYFSMEYAAKGSVLDELQTTRKIPLLRAVRIIRDACAALDYAERKGLVHRDIKPDNLMVMEDDTVKLGDLGLAMSTVELQSEQDGVFGTPHYIAPEQAMGKPIDHRADIYALGATFYRMLCGKTMYTGATVKEILKKQVREPHPSITEHLPDCPEGIRRILDRMLTKNPAERYQHASDVASDLADFENMESRRASTNGSAFAVRPQPIAADISQRIAEGKSRRNLILAAVAALAAVASAIVVVYLFVFNDPASNGQPDNRGQAEVPGNTEPTPVVDEAEQRAIDTANQNVDRRIGAVEGLTTRSLTLSELDERIEEIKETLEKNAKASPDRLKRLKALQDELWKRRVEMTQGEEEAKEEWQQAGIKANTLVEEFKIEGAKKVLDDFIKRWQESRNPKVKSIVDAATVLLNNKPTHFADFTYKFEQRMRREAEAAEKLDVALRPEAMAAVVRQIRDAEAACDSEEYKKRLAELATKYEKQQQTMQQAADKAAKDALEAAFARASKTLAAAMDNVRQRIARGEFKSADKPLQDWEVSDADYLAYGSTERFAAIRTDIRMRREQTTLQTESLRILGGASLVAPALPGILEQRTLLRGNEWPAEVATVFGRGDALISLQVDREVTDDYWSLESVIDGVPRHIQAVQFDTPQERRALATGLAHLFKLSEDMRKRLMDKTPSGPPAIVGVFAWLSDLEAYGPAATFIEHAYQQVPKSHAHHALVREYYAWSLLGRANEAALAGRKGDADAFIARLEKEFADTRANTGRK